MSGYEQVPFPTWCLVVESRSTTYTCKSHHWRTSNPKEYMWSAIRGSGSHVRCEIGDVTNPARVSKSIVKCDRRSWLRLILGSYNIYIYLAHPDGFSLFLIVLFLDLKSFPPLRLSLSTTPWSFYLLPFVPHNSLPNIMPDIAPGGTVSTPMFRVD